MVDRTYTYAVKMPFKELIKASQDDNNIDILHKEVCAYDACLVIRYISRSGAICFSKIAILPLHRL